MKSFLVNIKRGSNVSYESYMYPYDLLIWFTKLCFRKDRFSIITITLKETE